MPPAEAFYCPGETRRSAAGSRIGNAITPEIKVKTATHYTQVAGRRVRCLTLPPSADHTRPAPLGFPLLLIHGLGCSADIWGRALNELAPRNVAHGVIAADMPGYGRSESPPEAMNIEALADWVADLLDALGIARAHVAGNSMGCQVALAFARRHPERVGGLVLIGPTLGGGCVPGWRYGLGVLTDGLREPVLYAGLLPIMYFQMGVLRFWATFLLMLQEDTLAGAAEVQAPCLVVRGGGDTIIPHASARWLTAALPQGTFLKIAHSAHAVQFNRPESFAQVSLAFLSGTEMALPAASAPPQPAPLRVSPETPRASRRVGLACSLFALALAGVWAMRRDQKP